MTSPLASWTQAFGPGRTVFSTWCGLPEPSVAGYLARVSGFEAAIVDMQHGAIDFAATARAIPLVAAVGKPCIVRVPIGEFATASRLLDAGAAGIVAPMVNTVDDARRLAAFTKYPPVGERSWGPHPALALTGLGFDAYLAGANGFTRSFAMIETRDALDAIDAILGVNGVDGAFVGPSDLSISLSHGAGLDPNGAAVGAALVHVLHRARAAGKLAAVYAATGEAGATFARMGYDLVAVGSDLAFLRAGAAAAIGAATTA